MYGWMSKFTGLKGFKFNCLQDLDLWIYMYWGRRFTGLQVYKFTGWDLRKENYITAAKFYSSSTSSSSQDWLLNFLFPKGSCCLLAMWRETEPCLIFLNTDIASPWDFPWRICPFTDRISSPENKKYVWVGFEKKLKIKILFLKNFN